MDLSTVFVAVRWFECVHGTYVDPIISHKSIYYKSHTDEFTTVLVYTGDDTNIKRLFYATMHSLMMGQWGPQHVGGDVLNFILALTNCVQLLIYKEVIESWCAEWKM